MPWLIDSEFIVTEEMTAELHEIAEDIGLDLTTVATPQDARQFDRYIFQDIATVLGARRVGLGTFRNPNGLLLQAFADQDGGRMIVLDKALSVFLFRLGLFAVNYAFSDDDPLLRQELDFLLACRRCGMYVRGVGPDFGTYLRRYRDLYMHGNALWRAFVGYVMCHEIAHHQLGHLDRDACREQEFSADRLALAYFRRLVAKAQATIELRLTPNLLSAPAMLFRAEVFLDRMIGSNSAGTLHPAFEDRLERVLSFSRDVWTDEASRFYHQIDQSLTYLELQSAKAAAADGPNDKYRHDSNEVLLRRGDATK